MDTSTVPVHIGGKDVITQTTFPVTDPGSGSCLYYASSAGHDEASAAVDAATGALSSWSATKPNARRDIFLRAADALEKRRHELSRYMHQETGATKAPIDTNFRISASLLRDIAGRITESLGGFLPPCEEQGRAAMIVKEPYGVILAIAPWNAPYILGIRSVAYALAAGNTVVLKGSELSPRCMWGIGQVFKDAGLPDGCLNIVYTSREHASEVTELLVGHPAVRKLNFTGSTAIGGIIASLAGKYVKPCLMELGGKAAAIVLEDARLDHAAKQCAIAAFTHSGQICMSTERIVVQSSVYDTFIEVLKHTVSDMFPESHEAPIMIQPAAEQRNRSLVSEALEKGAVLVLGDHKGDFGPGNRLRPMILSEVTKDMGIYAAETFGPVVCLSKFDTVDEAIKIANDSEYGLSGSVFTENLQKGLEIAKQIESGAIHINASSIHNEPSLPHGGVKQSGWGKFNASWGMDEFLQTKTITFDSVI